MSAQVSSARRRPRPEPGDEACDLVHLDPVRVARVRERQIRPAHAVILAETFRLLGDPTRVKLLDALAAEELCVCDLATLVGGSVSAVSHQLRSLRALRLVRTRRDGRVVYYSLDDAHIVSLLHQGRRHVEEVGQAPAGGRRRGGRG